MKKYMRHLLPATILGMGITLAFNTARINFIDSHINLQAARVYQAASPTPTPQPISHPGSTDGIMLMGVIIFVIILLPILFRRSTWTR